MLKRGQAGSRGECLKAAIIWDPMLIRGNTVFQKRNQTGRGRGFRIWNFQTWNFHGWSRENHLEFPGVLVLGVICFKFLRDVTQFGRVCNSEAVLCLEFPGIQVKNLNIQEEGWRGGGGGSKMYALKPLMTEFENLPKCLLKFLPSTRKFTCLSNLILIGSYHLNIWFIHSVQWSKLNT